MQHGENMKMFDFFVDSERYAKLHPTESWWNRLCHAWKCLTRKPKGAEKENRKGGDA